MLKKVITEMEADLSKNINLTLRLKNDLIEQFLVQIQEYENLIQIYYADFRIKFQFNPEEIKTYFENY